MSRFIRSASLRLPNEEIERHTTWLEIFFDLIFAVIVIQLSDRLINHLTLIGLLQCIALFLPVMWTWASYTVFSARFDNDDAIHWLMTFIIMFAGIIMAIEIPVALEKGATGFSVGFLIGQSVVILLYARTIYDNLTPQNITKLYLLGFGMGGMCWLISLLFDSPIKFILWCVGMCIYIITPWIGKKRILSQAPLDTVYIPERFGAFTIIILGQIIASVVFGLASTNWAPFSLLTSIMAFILAILIWSQYYRFTLIADYKCTLGSGQPYIYTHIPLIISLIIIGACTEDFIKNSAVIQKNLNTIFCCAIILYLSSFYLLQYIATLKFKIRGLSYIGGVVAIFFLFFLVPLPPMITMSGIVVIFTVLFGIQYWLGSQQ
jgi:low temperature requirement protein LtrA